MGLLATDFGKLEQGIPYLRQAIKYNPNNIEYWAEFLNASALLNRDDYVDEQLNSAKIKNSKKQSYINHFKKLADIYSGNVNEKKLPRPIADHLLTLYRQNKPRRIIIIINALLKSNTQVAFLYNILSLAYNKINDLENARLNMLECLMLAPDYYEALNNYGLILQKLGYETDAIIQFKKALKIKPDFAEAFNNMGLSQRNLGLKREAKVNLKKAIRLDAQLCISYNNLKDLHTFSSEDPLIFQMEELLSDNGLQDSEKCHLHFALSKAYEDLDDLTTSYSHLKTGNALRKKVLKYDFSEDVQAFENIKLNTQNIKKVISSFDTDAPPKPIFILGMMRSGTTLVEQIVSRHSRVTGAGELGYLGRFGYDLQSG